MRNRQLLVHGSTLFFSRSVYEVMVNGKEDYSDME
jgi:hypothetical protein